MTRVRLLPKAQEDLADIWRYTLDSWGEDQAFKYTDDLDAAFSRLADQPLIPRERIEFSPPVRIVHHASHLIVYLVDDQGIIVIRVLHENMDVDAQLGED